MNQLNKTLMQLIGSEVLEEELNLPSDIAFNAKFLVDLLLLSNKHNVANVVASALLNNGYLENCPQKGQYMNELYKAVYICEKLTSAYDEVSASLEENGIDYIPLKGAVIRDFYPQVWMRTSCDIDILVKEKELKKALDVLLKLDGYSVKGENSHDVVVKKSDGAIIELHYKLLGSKKSPIYSEILSKVWDTAERVEGFEHRFKLNNEVFYYYHILHMAKHFRLGGCGLRPFLDLVLIEKNIDIDYEKADKLLKKGKLFEFAQNTRKLSKVWFMGEEHDETTLRTEEFILEGGIFGNRETRAESVCQRKGGKVGYMLSRVFVPYNYLKRDYPIIRKYPILTPFCEFCRIFSLLFGKKKKFKDSYADSLGKAAESDFDKELFSKLNLK